MKKINKEFFENVSLLYVEDDEMTLSEIEFFLKKYIKNLYIAKDGEEGLALYKEHKPDMVITDIQMPRMNGLEMCEEIFKINPEAPVAVTTAYSDGDYLIKAIELGIDKYLLKPINMLEMLTVIQKSLNLGNKKSCIENSECEDYINFILESSPTFMLVLHSDKIKYASKSFLELLGHEDLNSLDKHMDNFKNLFALANTDIKENWMDFVMQNNSENHLVSLNSLGNCVLKNRFYVTYKFFESTNKSVFVFIDTNRDKLNKINSITKDLLEAETLSNINIDSLRQILQLSTK